MNQAIEYIKVTRGNGRDSDVTVKVPIKIELVPRLKGEELFFKILTKGDRIPLDDYEQEFFESDDFKFYRMHSEAQNLNWCFDNFQEGTRNKYKALRMWG